MVLFQQNMLHRGIVLDCSTQDSITPFLRIIVFNKFTFWKYTYLPACVLLSSPQYRHYLIVFVVWLFLQDFLTKCFYVDMYLFLSLMTSFNILQAHESWKDRCTLHHKNVNTKYVFSYRKINVYVLRIIFWYVLYFLIPNDHSKM